MALSTNTYTYAGGAQTFVVNFALGFIQRSDVKVRVNLAVDGSGDPVYTPFTWTDDSNIVVTPTLTIGDSVQLERTVSKTELKVNFAGTADVTPANLDLSAKHGLMVYQELVDGRIEGAESPVSAADRASAASATAVSAKDVAVASAAIAATAAANVDIDQGVSTTDSPTFVNVTAGAFEGDGSALTGLPAAYTDANVDTHLNRAAATSGKVLSYTGTDYEWVSAGMKYTAVSGSTPSLNVGAYNFFDSGTLTADTTVSFVNVPTESRWTYSYAPALIGGQWDVSTMRYTGNSLSVRGYDSLPKDITFKPDGTKMYLAGDSADDVTEFDLDPAWDVSRATHVQTFDVAPQGGSPRSLAFKPNGMTMYMLTSQGRVNEYDLSVAWDISTATFVRFGTVQTQAVLSTGMAFKPDGTKMYIIGSSSDAVHEYDLGTAWDVSTIAYLHSFSVQTYEIYPQAVQFKPDGAKMYVTGQETGLLIEFDLGTAWDISTATLSQSVEFGAISGPEGIFITADGARVFAVASSTDEVLEHQLGDPATVTLPASVVNPPAGPLAAGLTRVTYDFFTTDGGATVQLISEEAV
ncbi:MAG: phage tail fiber protein [Flavobacteriaceae bacterium]|nr:phage tail fiber protein [Flavobacteriaceae bacterium]